MTKTAKKASKAKKSAALPRTAESAKYPRKSIPAYAGAGDAELEKARAGTALATSPDAAAYRVIAAAEAKTAIGELIDVPIMLKQLGDQAAAVNRGDMAHAESMLMNQATALQTLFVRLTERALVQDHLLRFETHMRLALRAQNQSRMTLETLATIKNPPAVFAKQANMTTGPQQINNGMAAPSRAREIENEQTQLSGGGNELLPDTRTPALASATNPTLEAVGKINGTKVGRG